MKNNKLSKNKNEIKLRQNSTQNKKVNMNHQLNKDSSNKNKINKSKINNQYGFDIYDKKNAQEFNRQFLGLNKVNNQNGMFAREGIFNMDLPMHKPGEVPDFSNPYGNNFFSNNNNIKLNLNIYIYIKSFF